MKTLYIGQFQHGSTSRMRAEKLSNLLKGGLKVIDTNIPFSEAIPIYRSLGFRYKIGPLISNINKYILQRLGEGIYDLVWIDKGVFLKPSTVSVIREKAKKLVHYTPDCSFFENKSKFFKKSIIYFDHLITTKSFETSYYPSSKLIYIPQGYNPSMHKPSHSFKSKSKHVVFIGLYEKARGEVIQSLIHAGISVSIGGFRWEKFKNLDKVEYLGEKVIDESYGQAISSAFFSLGLLSKRFPEKHTTRTFEIPACGTALITERNEETQQFFSESEAIFYDSIEEMIERIRYYQNHLSELEDLTRRGYEKVLSLGLDYESQLKNVLKQIL